MKQKEVVIRRPLIGNILGILGFVIVFLGSVYMPRDWDRGWWDLRYWIVKICIPFWGLGGLYFILFKMRKPIVVISDKGVTVPSGWGEDFVPWEKVDRIEVLVQQLTFQKRKWIGIFATDSEDKAGIGKISQEVTQGVTGWEEAPDLLINLAFSFIKIEQVMGILQEFHEAYQATHKKRKR